MRSVFLLAAVFSGFLLHAQQKDIPVFNFPGDLPGAALNQTTPPFTLSNGNKVYTLPQDRMPCVVPGTMVQTMPVIAPRLEPYTIPNPALPVFPKVEPMNAETLQKMLEEQRAKIKMK